jgi:hypothetical protein
MRLFFAFILFLPILTNGQLIKPNGKKWNSKEILDKMNDSTVYFIDTLKVSKNELNSVKPSDIALITAYFEDEPDLPSMFKPYLQNGAIAFVTKAYAISKYRSELSRMSSDYKELTKWYSNLRDSVLYIVDDDTLKPNIEGKLFNLNYSEIQSIRVVFPDEGQKSYGDKGQFGVVFIIPRKD